MRTIDDFPYLPALKPGPQDITYIFSGEWAALDNFAPIPVEIDGVRFTTSEHAFAYKKAACPLDAKRIQFAADPALAKAIGRRIELRPDWDTIKFERMREVVRAKMQQNAFARNLLLATGQRQIIEGNTWNDDIWGMLDNRRLAGTMRGRNALGRILMWVREELA